MGLSPENKLIIAMLCDIAKDKSERILNYQLIEEMLKHEEKWGIDWTYFINQLGKYDFEKTRLVVDVLDMCLMIKKSIDLLAEDDKQEIYAFNDGYSFVFFGFCKQKETDYHEIEKIYMSNLGYYSLLACSEYGSFQVGKPRIPRYLRMMKMYKQWMSEYPNAKRLSKSALIELISV